jgi:hypothetical protein
MSSEENERRIALELESVSNSQGISSATNSSGVTKLRKFKEVRVERGVTLSITSVFGAPVDIRIRSMVDRERRILSQACNEIVTKIAGTDFELGIRKAMDATAFVSTNSKYVGAYSGWYNEKPVVIFNAQAYNFPQDEFRVTVLHELLHLISPAEDTAADSEDEANHDLLCYELLGVPIPPNHWAFTKYPSIKKKYQVGFK